MCFLGAGRSKLLGTTTSDDAHQRPVRGRIGNPQVAYIRDEIVHAFAKVLRAVVAQFGGRVPTIRFKIPLSISS